MVRRSAEKQGTAEAEGDDDNNKRDDDDETASCGRRAGRVRVVLPAEFGYESVSKRPCAATAAWPNFRSSPHECAHMHLQELVACHDAVIEQPSLLLIENLFCVSWWESFSCRSHVVYIHRALALAESKLRLHVVAEA